jgi:hypothetical protein
VDKKIGVGIKKKRPNFLGRQSKDAIFGDAFVMQN